MTTSTIERTSLASLLAPHRADHLGFALATRTRSAQRARMERLTVMARTWDRLRER